MHIFLHFVFLRVETQKFLYNPTAMCFFFSRGAVFSSRQVFVFRDKYNSFSVECAKGIIISQLFFLSLVISVLGVEV